MKLIKINRKSVKKNPDYHEPGSKVYMDGPIEITIHYKGQPSKKQLKHCAIQSQILLIDQPIEYDLLFMGPQKLAFDLFHKDVEAGKCNIVVDMHRIDISCKDYGPEYIFNYQNPFVKCDECGISSRYSDFHNKGEDDEGWDIDQCPRCNATQSFNYELEKL